MRNSGNDFIGWIRITVVNIYGAVRKVRFGNRIVAVEKKV